MDNIPEEEEQANLTSHAETNPGQEQSNPTPSQKDSKKNPKFTKFAVIIPALSSLLNFSADQDQKSISQAAQEAHLRQKNNESTIISSARIAESSPISMLGYTEMTASTRGLQNLKSHGIESEEQEHREVKLIFNKPLKVTNGWGDPYIDGGEVSEIEVLGVEGGVQPDGKSTPIVYRFTNEDHAKYVRAGDIAVTGAKFSDNINLKKKLLLELDNKPQVVILLGQLKNGDYLVTLEGDNPPAQIRQINQETIKTITKNENPKDEDFSFYLYKVKSGDTLTSISQRYKISVDELRVINQIFETDSISEGKILKINLESVFGKEAVEIAKNSYLKLFSAQSPDEIPIGDLLRILVVHRQLNPDFYHYGEMYENKLFGKQSIESLKDKRLTQQEFLNLYFGYYYGLSRTTVGEILTDNEDLRAIKKLAGQLGVDNNVYFSNEGIEIKQKITDYVILPTARGQFGGGLGMWPILLNEDYSFEIDESIKPEMRWGIRMNKIHENIHLIQRQAKGEIQHEDTDGKLIHSMSWVLETIGASKTEKVNIYEPKYILIVPDWYPPELLFYMRTDLKIPENSLYPALLKMVLISNAKPFWDLIKDTGHNPEKVRAEIEQIYSSSNQKSTTREEGAILIDWYRNYSINR